MRRHVGIRASFVDVHLQIQQGACDFTRKLRFKLKRYHSLQSEMSILGRDRQRFGNLFPRAVSPVNAIPPGLDRMSEGIVRANRCSESFLSAACTVVPNKSPGISRVYLIHHMSPGFEEDVAWVRCASFERKRLYESALRRIRHLT